MKFYEIEKKRLKNKYQRFIIAALLFNYFFNVQAAWNSASINEVPGVYISYLNARIFLGIILISFYMNLQLFWQKEQGKRIFLMRKYRMIPVTRKEFYSVKMKIYLKYNFIYIIGTIIIFVLLIPANSRYQADLNLLRKCLEIIIVLVFIGVVGGIFLGSNILQERNN